jgi:hypothetical protein
MTGWIDRLLLGPVRRRRGTERRMRALDRQYAEWAQGGRSGRRQRGRSVDRTSWVSLAVTFAACVGMVVAVPSLLPEPLRDLVGLGPDRLAERPAVSGSGTFAFLGHQPGDPGEAVAYDPCRPIRVRINPDGAPEGGPDLVRRAMAEVEEATGLVLQYDGTSTKRPQWESTYVPTFLGRIQAAPVLVAWADEDEVPQVAGDVAGIGGSVAVTEPDGVVRYITGGVTLDAEDFDEIASRPDGEAEMRAIVLHELGHLVGLAHVEDPRELMNGDNIGLRDFGTGDRLGLAALGAGSCG